MLDRALASSALLLALTTVALLLGGRRPLATRLWRPIILVPLAAIAAFLTGPLQPDAPGVLAGAAAVLVAVLAPGGWWAIGAALFGSLVVATTIYAAYLIEVTVLLGGSPIGMVLGLVLLAIEYAALGLMVASVFEMVDALCRPFEVRVLPSVSGQWPTVCLQVPVHEEPAELVLETVRSLVALDYPPERMLVQVIDDNTADESLWRPLQAECEGLRREGHRVEFVHLEDWPGFKAGALNWGRTHLGPEVEVVGIVDADYVVRPDWLRQTVPHFQDPAVSFVQSPQEYRDWQGSDFYRACHTGFAYFFRVGMVSRNYRNSIIFAGTMGLIRRRALDEIGGWDEVTITEDAEASLRMLDRGGRGIYVPSAYGEGIMPLTYEALRGQRFRWAFGGIQILRKHWRSLLPWSRSGLTQRQRRDYLLGGLWWFNDALTLGFTLFIAATALGVVTGHPFVAQRLSGLGIVLPLVYILLSLVRYVWGIRAGTRVSAGEALGALRVNLSLSWVVTLACVRALVEERGVFLRTPKSLGGLQRLRQLRIVSVETVLAVVSAVLALWVLLVAGLSGLTVTVGALLAWAAYIYGSATSFALGDPTRPPAALRAKAVLELGAGQVLRQASTRLSAVVVVVAALLLLSGALATEAPRAPLQQGLPFEGALAPSPSPGPGAVSGSSASGQPASPGASAAGSAPPSVPAPSVPPPSAPPPSALPSAPPPSAPAAVAPSSAASPAPPSAAPTAVPAGSPGVVPSP